MTLKPGFLGPTSRPKRSTTPRSYCLTILTPRATNTSAATTMRPIIQVSIACHHPSCLIVPGILVTNLRRQRSFAYEHLPGIVQSCGDYPRETLQNLIPDS